MKDIRLYLKRKSSINPLVTEYVLNRFHSIEILLAFSLINMEFPHKFGHAYLKINVKRTGVFN